MNGKQFSTNYSFDPERVHITELSQDVQDLLKRIYDADGLKIGYTLNDVDVDGNGDIPSSILNLNSSGNTAATPKAVKNAYDRLFRKDGKGFSDGSILRSSSVVSRGINLSNAPSSASPRTTVGITIDGTYPASNTNILDITSKGDKHLKYSSDLFDLKSDTINLSYGTYNGYFSVCADVDDYNRFFKIELSCDHVIIGSGGDMGIAICEDETTIGNYNTIHITDERIDIGEHLSILSTESYADGPIKSKYDVKYKNLYLGGKTINIDGLLYASEDTIIRFIDKDHDSTFFIGKADEFYGEEITGEKIGFEFDTGNAITVLGDLNLGDWEIYAKSGSIDDLYAETLDVSSSINTPLLEVGKLKSTTSDGPINIVNSAGSTTASIDTRTGNYNGAAKTLYETLPANKGGTGLTSYRIGDILYASSTSALSKLSAPTKNVNQYPILGNKNDLPYWEDSTFVYDYSGVSDLANITGLSTGFLFVGKTHRPNSNYILNVNGSETGRGIKLTAINSSNIIADNTGMEISNNKGYLKIGKESGKTVYLKSIDSMALEGTALSMVFDTSITQSTNNFTATHRGTTSVTSTGKIALTSSSDVNVNGSNIVSKATGTLSLYGKNKTDGTSNTSIILDDSINLKSKNDIIFTSENTGPNPIRFKIGSKTNVEMSQGEGRFYDLRFAFRRTKFATSAYDSDADFNDIIGFAYSGTEHSILVDSGTKITGSHVLGAVANGKTFGIGGTTSGIDLHTGFTFNTTDDITVIGNLNLNKYNLNAAKATFSDTIIARNGMRGGDDDNDWSIGFSGISMPYYSNISWHSDSLSEVTTRLTRDAISTKQGEFSEYVRVCDESSSDYKYTEVHDDGVYTQDLPNGLIAFRLPDCSSGDLHDVLFTYIEDLVSNVEEESFIDYNDNYTEYFLDHLKEIFDYDDSIVELFLDQLRKLKPFITYDTSFIHHDDDVSWKNSRCCAIWIPSIEGIYTDEGILAFGGFSVYEYIIIDYSNNLRFSIRFVHNKDGSHVGDSNNWTDAEFIFFKYTMEPLVPKAQPADFTFDHEGVLISTQNGIEVMDQDNEYPLIPVIETISDGGVLTDTINADNLELFAHTHSYSTLSDTNYSSIASQTKYGHIKKYESGISCLPVDNRNDLSSYGFGAHSKMHSHLNSGNFDNGYPYPYADAAITDEFIDKNLSYLKNIVKLDKSLTLPLTDKIFSSLFSSKNVSGTSDQIYIDNKEDPSNTILHLRLSYEFSSGWTIIYDISEFDLRNTAIIGNHCGNSCPIYVIHTGDYENIVSVDNNTLTVDLSCASFIWGDEGFGTTYYDGTITEFHTEFGKYGLNYYDSSTGIEPQFLGIHNIMRASDSVSNSYKHSTDPDSNALYSLYGKNANIYDVLCIGPVNASACFNENKAEKNKIVVTKSGNLDSFASYGEIKTIITDSGNIKTSGTLTNTGADYAEYIAEWYDGNENEEDRRGLFVTVHDGKLYKSDSIDNTIGIISSNPTVVGNAYPFEWKNKYLKDVFGSIIYEDKEDVEERTEYKDVVTSEGEVFTGAMEVKTIKKTITKVPKLNPEYDPNKEYIPREDRPEWDCVALAGQLIIVDDGTCEVNGLCVPTDGGIGTKSTTDKGFLVLERLDETHIKILFK